MRGVSPISTYREMAGPPSFFSKTALYYKLLTINYKLNNMFAKESQGTLSNIALALGFALLAMVVFLALNFVWDLFAKLGVVSALPEGARTVTLSAEGKATAAPDTARFFVSVETRGADPEKVQAENTQAANDVIGFLKSQGVKDENIKTVGYNLNPEYDFPDGQRRLLGYVLSQTIRVETTELSGVGSLLAGAVERGANVVSGVEFFIDDPEIYRGQARDDALARLAAKKRELEKNVGLRLGRIVNFSESDFGFPPPIPYLERAVGLGLGGGGAPEFQPGSQEVILTISATYEIR